jgi:hypothetical protein
MNIIIHTVTQEDIDREILKIEHGYPSFMLDSNQQLLKVGDYVVWKDKLTNSEYRFDDYANRVLVSKYTIEQWLQETEEEMSAWEDEKETNQWWYERKDFIECIEIYQAVLKAMVIEVVEKQALLKSVTQSSESESLGL